VPRDYVDCNGYPISGQGEVKRKPTMAVLHRKVAMPFTISDLRQCPEFFDTVAERIWRAWWQPGGHPLVYIQDRLRENLNGAPVPFALVAHEGNAFLGTASAIASDIPDRPQFTPWVAAVWVEPPARRRGIGAALVGRAAQGCFALGFARAYLCARPHRSGFYESLGWTAIERDVGPEQMNILIRDAAPKSGAIRRSRP
jgi:N-acetylglutamate synthase-like GNAT family acetyltransferase